QRARGGVRELSAAGDLHPGRQGPDLGHRLGGGLLGLDRVPGHGAGAVRDAGTGLLGITGEDGWNYRAIPLFVALWILVGTLPLMLRAPTHPASAPGERWNPWQGYVHIVRRVVRAFREEPVMLQYLIASAIYRDGLG